MKNDQKEVTDVTIVKQETGVAEVLPIVFKDVDFSGLNDAISALGNASGDLDKDQRTSAVEILDDWNSNVIERLRMHSREMHSFLSFFNNDYYNNYYNEIFSKEEKEALAAKTETLELYNDFSEKFQALTDLNESTPKEPEFEDTMTKLEYAKVLKDYQYESLAHSTEVKKVRRSVEIAYKTWFKALNENSEVKALKAKANKYNKNLSKLINECNSKTNLAKLNVKIGCKDIRDSLKVLLDFTTTI